ncbi:MAG: glycosyltransferase [Pseudomonadota bacterium]|nr:glycosyltransferase [Pseudomonadota bacterium]
MRVLHVDTALELRGGQRQLAYLLAGRPDDAWAGVPGSPLAGLVGPPAVPLHPGADPRNALRLRRAAAEYDLVAAHTPHAHGIALFVGRPLVVHRRVDFVPRHPLKYRPVAAVVAVSEAVAGILRAAGVERVTVVHDGVAAPRPEAPLHIDAPRPFWGAAGALVPHKGHLHLVEAMAHTPGTLLVAGEGPLRASLEARAAALDLRGRVRFLGALPTLGAFFATLDAFVHPSVEEGLGQVVLEAMAAGCRVVTTTAGGLSEIVGSAGVLVPPGDAAALSVGMRAALGRPLGEGIARAGEFSIGRMVEGTSAVYSAVVGG